MRRDEYNPMRAAAMRIDRARQTAEYLDRRSAAIRTVAARAATVDQIREAGGLTAMLLAILGLPPCESDVDSALYADISDMRVSVQRRIAAIG